MYQCFFEHLSDAMLIADADCKIIRVNAAFVAITGYSENEVNADKRLACILREGTTTRFMISFGNL